MVWVSRLIHGVTFYLLGFFLCTDEEVCILIREWRIHKCISSIVIIVSLLSNILAHEGVRHRKPKSIHSITSLIWFSHICIVIG